MHFGSKFVYNYSDDEVEEYYEDSLDRDLDAAATKPTDKEEEARRGKKKRWRRADTNVLSVRFDHLASPSDMHTGDPVYCTSCGATISCISSINNQTWTCEFCNKSNHMDITADEVAKKDDITFMLQPSESITATAGEEAKTKNVDAGGTMVVFCVDISGSMSTDSRVPGRVDMGGRTRYQASRDITLVSRLEAVKVAVTRQIQEIAETSPEIKVALVTFATSVTAVGDGSSDTPLSFHGGHKTVDELKALGRDLPLPQSVVHTKTQLTDKVCDLHTTDMTALGPALLLSVAMASQVPGSKVIICTDGMANVGIGSLGSYSSGGQSYDEATGFYNDTAKYASEHGVSVSVITMDGTDCRLAELGHVAAATEGHVNIVDPLKLTEEFGNILIDRTIATNVTTVFILHQGLYFRDEDNENSKIVKEFGNVSKDTEITFEYGIRRNKKKLSEPMDVKQPATATVDAGESSTSTSNVPSVDSLSELPFQLQITYTDMQGAKAMRVLTQKKPVTKDREKAEGHIKSRVMLTHGTKMNANLVLEGRYKEAQMNYKSKGALMKRTAQKTSGQKALGDFMQANQALRDDIALSEKVERNAYGRTLSESDDSSGDEEASGLAVKKKSKAVVQKRQQMRKDGASKNVFANLKKVFKPSAYDSSSDEEED